jgi:hypothetical protein
MFNNKNARDHTVGCSSAAEPPLFSFVAAIVAFIFIVVGAIVWLHYENPRLLGSWHGFLHTAIANRFSTNSFPPENPFFAGEPLPYYWFNQFVVYWIARLLRIDLLHTFHLVALLGLIVFIVFSGLIGRTCFRSNVAGVLIAYLALTGLNPLGPGIAIAKHLLRGQPLINSWPAAIETTFVTDQLADALMTEPLLPAMYISTDWRHGQNLVWFFDVGSRAPALSMLVVLLYLLLKPGGKWGRCGTIVVISSLVTAFSVIIGLAFAAITVTVAFLTTLGPFSRFLSGQITGNRLIPLKLAALCLAGALLALPTYHHLFFRASGSSSVILGKSLPLALAVIAGNFLLLIPLAIMGISKAKPSSGIGIGILGVSALLLLFAVVFIHLPEGNEHNLTNAAQCLLAIPAAGAIVRLPRESGYWWARRTFVTALVFLAFAPVTVASLFAHARRPPIPLAVNQDILVRLPRTGDLESLYQWIRSSTALNSIFITDPELPLKMSGNVSELPAFTSRTLFTDLPNYLTEPNQDSTLRAQLARQAAQGVALTREQQHYLSRFGRPVYLLTFRTGEPDVIRRLTQEHGESVFTLGMVSVFQLDTPTNKGYGSYPGKDRGADETGDQNL